MATRWLRQQTTSLEKSYVNATASKIRGSCAWQVNFTCIFIRYFKKLHFQNYICQVETDSKCGMFRRRSQKWWKHEMLLSQRSDQVESWKILTDLVETVFFENTIMLSLFMRAFRVACPQAYSLYSTTNCIYSDHEAFIDNESISVRDNDSEVIFCTFRLCPNQRSQSSLDKREEYQGVL